MNFNVPQAEKFWREKISQQIKELIDSESKVNAQGVYLFVRNGNDTGFINDSV